MAQIVQMDKHSFEVTMVKKSDHVVAHVLLPWTRKQMRSLSLEEKISYKNIPLYDEAHTILDRSSSFELGLMDDFDYPTKTFTFDKVLWSYSDGTCCDFIYNLFDCGINDPEPAFEPSERPSKRRTLHSGKTMRRTKSTYVRNMTRFLRRSQNPEKIHYTQKREKNITRHRQKRWSQTKCSHERFVVTNDDVDVDDNLYV